jgi:hypothetical protein
MSVIKSRGEYGSIEEDKKNEVGIR